MIVEETIERRQTAEKNIETKIERQTSQERDSKQDGLIN